MTNYQITLVNDEFRSISHSTHADPHRARAEALKGALEVGSEQILAGKSFFGAELIIEGGNSRERLVLSIGASTLR